MTKWWLRLLYWYKNSLWAIPPDVEMTAINHKILSISGEFFTKGLPMGSTEKPGYFKKLKNLSKIQKFVFWSLIAVILYTLTGFFAAPPLLKLVLERKIPEILHRSIAIKKIKLNPYTLTATVENFSLQQKENSADFISFERLFVNLQLSSIVKRALVIKAFQLSGARVTFARLSDTEYSFSDLLAKKVENQLDRSNEQPGKPFLFSVNNIEIVDAAIEFQDNPKDKIHRLSALNLAIPTISNLPIYIDTQVQPSLSAKINGTDFSLAGKTKPFAHSHETVFDLKLTKLNIPEYLAYIPNQTEATIKAGTIDIDTQLSYFDAPGDQRLSLSGLLSLRDLNLVNLQDESFARFPRIDIQIAASNLLKQDVVLESVHLARPELDFSRQANELVTPLSLFVQETQGSPAPDDKIKGESRPVTLSLQTINIANGRISFVDQIAGNFATTLTPFDLTITNFSTKKETRADFIVKTKSELDELITLQGRAGIAPLVVDGKIALTGLNLNKYHPYLTDILNPEITGGKMNFASHFFVSRDELEAKTSLDSMTIELSDFSLAHGPETLINIPLLTISETKIDLPEQQLTIGQLKSQSAKFLIRRGKEGEINLASIIKETEKRETPGEDGEAEIAGTEKSAPWIVTLTNGNIEKYSVVFVDDGPTSPFTANISDLSLALSNISTTQDSIGEVSFSCKLDGDGELAGKGPLGISPLTTVLTLEGNNLALPPLQNYAAVQAKIHISNGAVSTSGELSIAQKDTFSAHFKGMARIADLSLADAAGEDLLKWKEFYLSGIEFSSQPQNLTIKEVQLKDIFLQITVLEDGGLNLAKVLHPTPETTGQAEEPPVLQNVGEKREPMEIAIDTVILSDASFNFQDQKISPAYAATIDNFGGTITGLSTKKDSLAQVELKGSINQHAPVAITGAINPLKEDIFADLKLDFHDIDLSPTSPYTGKFIGYKTDKGKLTLNLHYNINGKELEAENQVFLDQFTLGDFVESPDAVSLPIHLAIALLKNRSGEIFLDIPVSGNLDDPEFSVSSVVFRVLFNLIAKAATSPFALLGALIPDGEDMQFVSFTPGLADIEQSTADKLAKMASVLYERPGLRMDILGSSAPDKDRQALALLRLKQQVRLQKIKEHNPGKTDEKTERIVTINEDEYPHYLELAYQEIMALDPTKDINSKDPSIKDVEKPKGDGPEAKTASPNDLSAPTKLAPLTIEVMENSLLQKITVTDEDLRLLAIRRANNVLDFLAEKGPVESERLFIIEPKAPSEQKTDAAEPTARVELIIK